ncbi:MAG: MFS transporter [Thermoplasmata archaeon]
MNIIVLAFVSLLTDTSSEMMLPLFPTFVAVVLAGSPLIFGLIEGIAESTASLLKVVSGFWSDRLRKRRGLVATGYGLSSLSKLLFYFSVSWIDFTAFRFLERAGKGIRASPRDAIIAESTSRETTGRAFGFHRAADTTGAILGPVLIILLLPLLGGGVGENIRTIFLIAAVPAIIAFLVVFLVKEKPVARAPPESLRVGFSLIPKKLKLFVLAATMFEIGNFSVLFLVYRGTELINRADAVIALYLLFNVSYALLAFPAGILSDKIGKKAMIGYGYGIFMATFAGFVFASDITHLAILFLSFGLCMAMLEGVQRAYVADMSPKNMRATAMGTYHTFTGVAKFPASLIAGFLWLFNPAYAFLFGIIMASWGLVFLSRVE